MYSIRFRKRSRVPNAFLFALRLDSHMHRPASRERSCVTAPDKRCDVDSRVHSKRGGAIRSDSFFDF